MNNNQIVKQQREYWREVAKEHEGTVQAVGSESELHKKLRYKKIAEIFNGRKHISVHDIGAGVGDFYSYLRTYVEGGGDHYLFGLGNHAGVLRNCSKSPPGNKDAQS